MASWLFRTKHTLTADIQEVILGGRLNSVTERLQALAALVCGGPVAFTILCLIRHMGWL